MPVLRSWVGSGPTAEELNAAYDRLGSYDAVVLEVLRARLTALTEEPASLSVPGLSYSNGINITALESTIKRFEMSGTGLDSDKAFGYIRTGRLVRYRPR